MVAIPPLTPYLTVADAAAAIEFYQNAFGASIDMEPSKMPGTDKIMHARLMINGSLIMLADDFSEIMNTPCMTPPALGGSPIVLALQMDDAQSFWDKAIAGGAIVTMPLAKQFWGAIYGQFDDPFGHKWSVSQTIVEMTDEEMRNSAQKTLDEKGTLRGEPV